MTIIFPLKFRSQDIPKHSKYAIPLIIVLALLGNIPALYGYSQLEGTLYCYYDMNFDDLVYFIENCVRIIVPFMIIVISNGCTVATLFKQERNSISPIQGRYINVFTKLTILTGLSFIVSNSIEIFDIIWFGFDLGSSFPELGVDVRLLIIDLKSILCYFNCFMNPIICMVICKSMYEDIKTFGQQMLPVFRFN